MNYWKLMAGQGSRYISEFLDGNYIAVGFAKASVPGSANNFEVFRELVRNTQSDVTKGQADSWGSQLYRFYREMNSGDRVLVYDPSVRLYHVAEVASKPQYDASADLWHKRDVKWVGKVERDALSPNARNTLGAIITLFSVNPETQKEIEDALSGKRETETMEEEKEEVQQLGDEIIDRSREFLLTSSAPPKQKCKYLPEAI
jgi:restriction system protein